MGELILASSRQRESILNPSAWVYDTVVPILRIGNLHVMLCERWEETHESD
jgi:hypothetical protein